MVSKTANTYLVFFDNIQNTEVELNFKNRGLSPNFIIAVLTSLAVSLTWFGACWRLGFDLSDEGYYWYGAQRILNGEMPMRDFMSYDFGRYYWAAAVMYAIGDAGILGARIAALMFQTLTISVGVFLCLWALTSSKLSIANLTFALSIALTLTLWMLPYYKTFDHGASILVVGMIVLLLNSLNIRAWFIAGLLLGFVALIGRNHGVYGSVAAAFALILLLMKVEDRNLLIRPAGYFVVAVLLAFSPTFLLMVCAPGFQDAFVESISALIRDGQTNISLPIPWPWTFNLTQLGWITWALAACQGAGFILLVMTPLVILIALAPKRISELSSAHTLLLASAMAGIPYAHYAFSRADLTHLALGIFPLLLGFSAIGVLGRAPLANSVGLLLLSCFTVSASQPLLAKHIWQKNLYAVTVSGQEIFTSRPTAERIADAKAALARHPNAANSFLAQPDMPSFHAMYQMKISIWEIYSLYPRDSAFEEPELARLIASPPKLILISDHALDSREEFRYNRMHPLIYAWVKDNYILEQTNGVDSISPSGLQVYVAKDKVES